MPGLLSVNGTGSSIFSINFVNLRNIFEARRSESVSVTIIFIFIRSCCWPSCAAGLVWPPACCCWRARCSGARSPAQLPRVSTHLGRQALWFCFYHCCSQRVQLHSLNWNLVGSMKWGLGPLGQLTRLHENFCISLLYPRKSFLTIKLRWYILNRTIKKGIQDIFAKVTRSCCTFLVPMRFFYLHLTFYGKTSCLNHR